MSSFYRLSGEPFIRLNLPTPHTRYGHSQSSDINCEKGGARLPVFPDLAGSCREA